MGGEPYADAAGITLSSLKKQLKDGAGDYERYEQLKQQIKELKRQVEVCRIIFLKKDPQWKKSNEYFKDSEKNIIAYPDGKNLRSAESGHFLSQDNRDLLDVTGNRVATWNENKKAYLKNGLVYALRNVGELCDRKKDGLSGNCQVYPVLYDEFM